MLGTHEGGVVCILDQKNVHHVIRGLAQAVGHRKVILKVGHPKVGDHSFGSSRDAGCRFGAARFFSQAKSFKVSIEESFVNEFRHDVSGILSSGNLKEFEVLGPQSLLDPEVRHG